MDMPADHVVIIFFNGQFRDGCFEFVDIGHRFLYTILNPFRKRNLIFSQHLQAGVDHAVEQDQQVVSFTAELGQDFCRTLSGIIKNIPVKDPGFFVVNIEQEFVGKQDIAYFHIGVAAQEFIMVTGDVDDTGAFSDFFEDFIDDLEMRMREITFAELPGINNIPVQDKYFGINAF